MVSCLCGSCTSFRRQYHFLFLVGIVSGTEIYQEILAKALAKYFKAKLLIFDGHPILGVRYCMCFLNITSEEAVYENLKLVSYKYDDMLVNLQEERFGIYTYLSVFLTTGMILPRVIPGATALQFPAGYDC